MRRQITWEFRKPLIVFTPKSLLRDPLCKSKVSDLTDGKFEEIIDDTFVTKSKVTKLILCTGKIYYDLYSKQQADKRKDVAIVRIEQLYPLPAKKIEAILKKYSKAECLWVQEEPLNMGGWSHLLRWRDLFKNFECVSRKSSASPATGFAKVHAKEQQDIIEKAFS